MIPIDAHFVNLPDVLASLTQVERGVESLRPLWERFETEFYKEEVVHFAANLFAPLTPEYAKRKQETFGDKPTLRATDALYNSLTEQGAPGNINVIEDSFAEFGTSDPKAVFHAEGTPHMPVRDPLAEPDEEAYTTIASEYLQEVIVAAGFH